MTGPDQLITTYCGNDLPSLECEMEGLSCPPLTTIWHHKRGLSTTTTSPSLEHKEGALLPHIRKRGISFSNFCFLLPIFFSFFMKKEAKDCNSFKRHLTRLLLTYYTFVHFSLLMFLKMRTGKGKKKVEENTFSHYCSLLHPLASFFFLMSLKRKINYKPKREKLGKVSNRKQ